MPEITLLPTLETIADRWHVLAGEHPRVPTSQLLTQACAAAGVQVNGREVETVCLAYRIPPDATRERRLLLLTVLLGDQRLRLEAAFRLLDPNQRGTVDPAQVQRLIQLFDLPEAEAKELVVELNRDGSGEITLADVLAFLPADFSSHPKAYHAAHLGGRPGAHGAGTGVPTPQTASSTASPAAAQGQPMASPAPASPTAPASPPGASQGGTSPLQMRIGLFRLLQGAAYRSFRENYSANSETHLRAYDLPYTIPNFVGFVNAALDLYQSLGIVEVGAQEPLEDLRSSVNGMLEQLEARMCELKRLVASELLSARRRRCCGGGAASGRGESVAAAPRWRAARQFRWASGPLPPPPACARARACAGGHNGVCASLTAGRADNGAARGAARDNGAGRQRRGAAGCNHSQSRCRKLPAARSHS